MSLFTNVIVTTLYTCLYSQVSLLQHEITFTCVFIRSFSPGPSHVTIFISEKPHAHIVRWSFGHQVPVEVFTLPFMTEPTFFIYFSHPGNTTWHFSIDVQVSDSEKHTMITPRV